jgi:hypothetical protein
MIPGVVSLILNVRRHLDCIFRGEGGGPGQGFRICSISHILKFRIYGFIYFTELRNLAVLNFCDVANTARSAKCR